ncbi:S1 family peptidase [Kibdelosporangium phytohabitans]|uniref:Streptogrisin n=1 Tax=Kibdelosporangium phytohabitans TaxID=860235 RepID=A0A0N7F3A2_9PSEU|nr:S1 family peptidase [Kibdelosporangium phytohabitans]ALG08063.1 streptogrisin [Kibdelosporangium phytohabitans]MBE1470966.1 streptogrisin C [Kibdelosporangium phytohabitans]
MSHHLPSASRAAVVTVALMAIATLSGTADAAPVPATATASDLAPEVLTALQRDTGLNPDAARARLAADKTASDTGSTLRKRMPSTFGGAWINEGKLVVGVTDTKSADAVRAAGGQARLVWRTEGQLDAVKSKLDANATAAPKTVPGWFVDPASNSVVVKSRPSDFRAAYSFAAASGADMTAVRVEASEESPRPLIDVIGGNAYYIGSGTRCSVGFSVNGGFVTAGHCGTTGASTTQPSGTFRGSSFPGNDYAWVQVAAGNTPRGLVNNYSNGTVAVAGSQDAAIGATVCRSGSTTGWHCGTIRARNSSVSYPQGTVSGLIQTNVCAEPGDSGGSLLAGSQAQGVTSGGSGNCSSGGTTYFQPVNEILQTYGLTLVTGGGGPGPGTCQNPQNTYNGSLTSNQSAYQPNGGSYTSNASGAHVGCLNAPAGTDFDLYLEKRNGSTWTVVAKSDSPQNVENINYNGTAGTYRYRVHAYSGSGSYTLGVSKP